MTASNQRYQGKPLLRLLECYVLWTIDQLPETESGALRQMTPNLQSLYRRSGEWHDVIAAAIGLPPNAPELIRDLWLTSIEIARKNGVTLSPQRFAEMFVDQDLAD